MENRTKQRPTHSRRNFKNAHNPKNEPANDNVKIMVLGGLEEVGRNMTLIEYKDDIIIIDMGLQFPEEDMPGIDYIIPNIEYLRGKKDKIRGVIITHGHLDHIGAIPHIMEEIGNPPIFGGKLTLGLVRHRWEDHRKRTNLNLKEVDENSHFKLGKGFGIGFMRVNHSIPDCFAIIIDTPLGKIVHTGDFKIDYSPVNDKPADLNSIALLGGQGVKLLMSDSTDATHKGYQISESAIGDQIDKIFEKSRKRLIIGTFASQISRMQKLFDLAAKHKRRVSLQGRSINNNVEVAHKIGYLKFDPKILIDDKDLSKTPDNKIMIIGTRRAGRKQCLFNKGGK